MSNASCGVLASPAPGSLISTTRSPGDALSASLHNGRRSSLRAALPAPHSLGNNPLFYGQICHCSLLKGRNSSQVEWLLVERAGALEGGRVRASSRGEGCEV